MWWKIFTNSPSTLTFCLLQKMTCLDLNNLFMARFQLIRMSTYAKYKLQMCSVTQRQCETSSNVWKKVAQIHTVHSPFVLLQKMTCLDWTIYSWQGLNSIGCPLMLRTNYRWVQSLNISVDVAKCVKIFTNSPSTLTFWSVTTNDLSWQNNLFTARFQLIRKSSNVQNKATDVFRHSTSVKTSPNVWKSVPKFTQYTHYLVCYKKWLFLTEESIHGKVSTH